MVTHQIEIYFSILARKALTSAHFHNTDEVAERVLGFQHEFAKTAKPFDWTFTRQDLHTLLDRLDQRGRLTPPVKDRENSPLATMGIPHLVGGR